MEEGRVTWRFSTLQIFTTITRLGYVSCVQSRDREA